MATLPCESDRSEAYFESARCRMRNWVVSDAERVLDTYSRWEVARWLGSDPKAMETLEQAQAFVARRAERNEADVGGLWAVERKDDGVVAGAVLRVPLPGGDGELEVGWHFHPDSWGHGLATESARAALRRGFDHGLPEAYAVIRPDNERSIAVCRRIGMQACGLTTKYDDAELALFRITREGCEE